MSKTVFGIIGKELTLADFLPYQSAGFTTTQSDLLKYNGQPFTILRSLTDKECDLVVAPIFEVKFAVESKVDAHMDEIFEDKLFDELVLDENLVR